VILAAMTASDWIGISSLAFNLAFTVALMWFGGKVREIQGLRDELKAATKREIDSRFEGFETRCGMKHQTLAREVEAVQERLGRGDQTFDKINDMRHSADRELLLAISELKETMLRECARREDVEALKTEVGRLSGRVDAMAEAEAQRHTATEARRR
jgi:hypothetical protein